MWFTPQISLCNLKYVLSFASECQQELLPFYFPFSLGNATEGALSALTFLSRLLSPHHLSPSFPCPAICTPLHPTAGSPGSHSPCRFRKGSWGPHISVLCLCLLCTRLQGVLAALLASSPVTVTGFCSSLCCSLEGWGLAFIASPCLSSIQGHFVGQWQG